MSITHARPVTTVVLFQGTDLDPLEERRAAWQKAAVQQITGKAPLRVGDDGEDDAGEPESPTDVKAREHDDFLDEALERATHVRLAAMARKAYGALLAEFPPRRDRKAPDTVVDGETVPGEVLETFEQDAQYGFDVDGISEPLVLGCLTAYDEDALPEGEAPQFEDADARQAFVDGLSEAEFSRVFSAAVKINRGGGPDPKVRLSSLLDRT